MPEKKMFSFGGRLFPTSFRTEILSRFVKLDDLVAMAESYESAKLKRAGNGKKEYQPTEDDVRMWREWVAGKKMVEIGRENDLSVTKLMYKFLIVGKTMGKTL